MSCLIIIEASFVQCRSDRVTQREQLDETFHCAFSVVVGFLMSLDSQTVC